MAPPERYETGTRPPMVIGGVLQGRAPLLLIWATAYNKKITAGATPTKAAKHAIHEMLTRGKMADISQMGYYTAQANDPGSPPGFTFQPGQQFPITPGGPLSGTSLVLVGTAPSFVSGIPCSIIIPSLEIIYARILEILALFTGKPRELDTEKVGERFCGGQNPASFICGTLIL